MKLTKVHIENFQSIRDSTEFEVGDVTCLVGKNESGKTALLKALYRLNPVNLSDASFDATDDYPRRDVVEYSRDVERERRKPARVIRATFELEPSDVQSIKDQFGPECLNANPTTLTLTKGYDNQMHYSRLEINESAALRHLVGTSDLTQSLREQLNATDTVEHMLGLLTQTEQTESTQRLLSSLQRLSENGLSSVIFNDYVQTRIPKFLYFDEYYQMKGEDSVDALRNRVAQNALTESDYPS